MKIRNILSWFVLAAVVALLAIGFANFQEISDWLKLRNYQPGSRIVELADKTTMKDGARRVFYVNHPQLNDKQEFKGNCYDKAKEETIVLGCYVSSIDRKGIYLLNVTDKRLEGVVEVTAAHEMLHAMYERLDKKERQRIDRLTIDFFTSSTDERLKQTIENYRAKDPAVVPSELHSILPTEVHTLTPELEQYYVQYFSDRQKVVEFSDKYEKAFIDIETKAEAYEDKLADLKQKIETNKLQIESMGKEIDERQKELEALLSSNQVSEYNQQVPKYNRLVEEYNRMVNQTKQTIASYNELLEQRNQLIIQQHELYEAIDSNAINEKR
ncbi:MAG TPA: hypothetical protein VD947_00645 [Patescibacteria group bacterium]|nr:hypothetical protein [Patescibacteria group bacterium]